MHSVQHKDVVHVMCSETSLTFVADFTLCQNYSKEKKTFRSKTQDDGRAVTQTHGHDHLHTNFPRLSCH